MVGILVLGFLLCEAIVGQLTVDRLRQFDRPAAGRRRTGLDDEADDDGDLDGDADHEDGPKR